MAKKKKQLYDLSVVDTDLLKKDYLDAIEKEPRYSLTVNAEGKYNMTDEQIKFVQYYVDTKDIGLAAKLTGIDMDLAMTYFFMFSSQQEIRRINLAQLHRRCGTNIMTYEQIEGYLTSLLIDEFVPMADRLSQKEKLEVIRMIVNIKEVQQNYVRNPVINQTNIELQLSNLSVSAIKALLAEQDKQSSMSKEELIERIKQLDENLTPEDKALLEALSVDELLNLLNVKGDNNGQG